MTLCQCGAPSMHTTSRWWAIPRDEHQCCACYVKSGESPADWHPDCMTAKRELEAKRKLETRP